MKTTILSIAFCLLATSLAVAQVTTIDTRGQEPTTPTVRITGGTGSSSANAASSQGLQLQLNLPFFANLVVGNPFDYELLVTNKSAKPIQLPQSMFWASVEDSSQSEQRFQELEVSFAVVADSGESAPMGGHLTLYGRESNPSTMITLKPGESVRILGSATFAPQWKETPPQRTAMHMVAYLAVNAAQLLPVDSEGNRYSKAEGQLYWTQSKGQEIMFKTEQ